MTYFEDVYNAMPSAIETVVPGLIDQSSTRKTFPVELVETANLANGFDLKCDSILWHISWNPNKSWVEASENGTRVHAIDASTSKAKYLAEGLVKDIHRRKLMTMPSDFSDVNL